MDDHLTPYPLHGRLQDPLMRLARALALWESRDDTRPQPEVRRAANDAMDTIDAMLSALHALRSRLVSEIRASDDATAARADRLLAATDSQLGDLNKPADPLVRRLRFEAADPDITISPRDARQPVDRPARRQDPGLGPPARRPHGLAGLADGGSAVTWLVHAAACRVPGAVLCAAWCYAWRGLRGL